MTDAQFQRLVARLRASGGVYLRDGGVHVASEVWGTLTDTERRALVARRDAIRELLQGAGERHVEGSSEGVPEVPDGLHSRRSQGGNANDGGVIGGASSERVAAVSPSGGDSAVKSASRDGQSEGSSEGVGSTVEGGDAVGDAQTAGSESDGAGDVSNGDRPPAGNVAASEGESNENSGIDSVSSVSKGRPGDTQGNTKSKHSSKSRYAPRYQRHGNSLVDVESFEWWSRKYHRKNDYALDQVRRDAERDFGRLGEMTPWGPR